MEDYAIVRTESGEAKVNWCRDGMVGITYISGRAKDLSAVLPIHEVEWIEGSPEEIMTEDFSSLSEEELRNMLIDMRRSRRPENVIEKKKTAPKKTAESKKTTTSRRKVTKNSLEKMSKEEMELIIKLLSEGS